jgi:hypothetical protein
VDEIFKISLSFSNGKLEEKELQIEANHSFVIQSWNFCRDIKHFRLFIKKHLTVKARVKHQSSKAGYILLLFTMGYVFLLFSCDVCCHEQLNLLIKVPRWTPSYLFEFINEVFHLVYALSVLRFKLDYVRSLMLRQLVNFVCNLEDWSVWLK